MTRGRLITIGGCAVTAALMATGPALIARAQQAPPATFKSSVDLVRVSAVVRDHKGRFVQDLTARDFEVLDGGQTRSITDLQRDLAGISVAVLFDVSGSMEGHMPNAREAATHVLSWMDASRDEAAVYTIDNPESDASTHSVESAAFAGPLADLASWTGGHVFVASTPGQRSVAARQIIDELRHQYVIAFESSGRPGWHPLVVRARNKDLIVRARSGYIAGQSRPTAH